MKIAIVIPAKNAERTILRAIESAFNQGLPPDKLRILVLDDASRDSTAARAEAAGVEVVRSGQHQGVPRAHAAAWFAALEDPEVGYVGQVDSDDWIEYGAVAVTASALDASPGASFAYTQYRQVSLDGTVNCRGVNREVKDNSDLLGFHTHHFRLIRADAYRAVNGHDLRYPYASDYDLCLRLAEWGPPLFVNRALYNWTYRPDSHAHSNRAARTGCESRAIVAARARRGVV